MQSTPLVSVIVPCYNQQDYIDEALQSVYEQTYTNWECIIVNDGSQDKSEKKILDWISKDNRFRYYHKNNSGVAESRNYAIKQSRGEYIVPLDGDDKLHRNYIRVAIQSFDKSPNTKLVYCDPTMFGSRNDIIKSRAYSFEALLTDNTIPCTGVYRREDFNRTQGYNTNMTYGLEDWDFWLSLLHKDDLVIKLNDNLVFYRIKDISRSTVLKEQNDKNEAMLLQLFKNHSEKYLEFFNPLRDRINHLHYKQEFEDLRKSKEYKIGTVIYRPYYFIKKVLKRIFG